MNIGLTEEQTMLEEALARYLEETVALPALQAIGSKAAPPPRELGETVWRGLVDLGVTGLLVPQDCGGSGLGMLEAGLAAERLGAAAAPVPFAGAVVMATQAMLAGGCDAQKQHWLPRIAQGSARIAVAFDAKWTGDAGQGETALREGRLDARIDAVPEAEGATHFLVFTGEGAAALVDAGAVNVQARDSVDVTRRISSIAIGNAACELLAGGAESGGALAQRVLDAGRLALACDALGACRTMLDRSVAHAKERVQFGRPIGSFQGVKYLCADMVTMLEPCRALSWQAAMLFDSRTTDSRVAALQAKAHIGDVAREVSRMAVEVHGGVGFTDMLGMPFWFRRCALDRQLLGGPERCREEAAHLQGWDA
jgi:alkylation response protein AidB-like acyl-CoA dehydrogenase